MMCEKKTTNLPVCYFMQNMFVFSNFSDIFNYQSIYQFLVFFGDLPMPMTDAQIEAQIESNRRAIAEAETSLALASKLIQEGNMAASQAMGCSPAELDQVLRSRFSADDWQTAQLAFDKSLQDAGITLDTPSSTTPGSSPATRQHRRMV